MSHHISEPQFRTTEEVNEMYRAMKERQANSENFKVKSLTKRLFSAIISVGKIIRERDV